MIGSLEQALSPRREQPVVFQDARQQHLGSRAASARAMNSPPPLPRRRELRSRSATVAPVIAERTSFEAHASMFKLEVAMRIELATFAASATEPAM
jgi:hypothetical protein